MAAASEMGTPDSTKLLERLVEQSREHLEETKKQRETIESLTQTAKCAEMRQCQSSGEGTDSSRLTSMYIRGHSATWSQHHRECTLELLYKSGCDDSVGYAKMFCGKDTRRSQLAGAIFWRTHVEPSGEFYDIYSEHDQNSDELFKLLPSYREELLEAAHRKDVELGPEVARLLPRGPYRKRIKEVLGEVPEGLLALYEYMLPVGRSLEVVAPSAGTEDAWPVEMLKMMPEKVHAYFHSCGLLSRIQTNPEPSFR